MANQVTQAKSSRYDDNAALISLPLIVGERSKSITGVWLFLIAVTLYLFTNHIHFFLPQTLPLTWIDQAIPFKPYTFWVYVSEYFFFVTVYAICKNVENLNKFVYSFVSLQIVSAVIFILWPTTYPRDAFPLPADLDSVTAYLFRSLRETDTPANCCPSLHVSSVYLSALLYLEEQRRKLPFFLLWSTAIAASTLTTKQHYLVDVISGFFVAVLFYWVFHKMIGYRSKKS